MIKSYKTLKGAIVILSSVADWFSIASFILSLILLIFTGRIKHLIKTQKEDYQAEQRNIRLRLKAFRENILLDQLFTIRIISEMRTALWTYKQNYKYVLSPMDKIRIMITVKMLDGEPESIDYKLLCKRLDRLIVRFAKKEV